MNPRAARTARRRHALALLFLLVCAAGVGAQAPQVNRIEPPNWWVGLKPDVMLLLGGKNLEGATVHVSHPGVNVARVEPGTDGRYLFVWLKLAPQAQPGRVALNIHTAHGDTSAEVPLHARRPADENFQGLSGDDVIYLIMPDRFANGDTSNDQPSQSAGTYDRSKPRAYHGGDLRGIRDHLPYLRDLGVTALWLNPIYDNDNVSPGDYHGYGAVDYYAVDEHLGTLQDLQALVTAAHQHGIKVFLDNVPNHCGPKHPWVKALPQAGWFHGTPENRLVAQALFENLVDPHAPPRSWRDLVEGWFAGVLPDLNQENPRVQEYLLLNSIWWAEQTGLDGYRLDTFPYVSRRFWSEWHRDLFRIYPKFATIGEVFHGDISVTSFFAGGHPRNDAIDSRVTTLFDFPLFFAIRDVTLRDAPAKRLLEVLQRDWMYPDAGRLVTFLGNHDVRRFASESGSSKEKLKLAFSLLATLRGVPQLYSGDEIGMEGGEDPDNRRDFPGGWPGDARNAFAREGRTADEQEIFEHLQSLLRLRKEHPALRLGRQWHLAWNDATYVFLRETHDEQLVVAFNNSGQPRVVRAELQDTPLQKIAGLSPLLAAAPATIRGGYVEVKLPPRSLAIYTAK